MNDIVFVTGNIGKVESARKCFNEANVNLQWYKYDADEPNVNDIEFIAKEKVLRAYEMIGKPCIALDAGFYIDNFPGQPGFPGAFPKRELLDSLGLEGLLKKMNGVEDRSCYFRECLAYYDGNDVKYFYGTSNGILSTSIMGDSRECKWSDLWYVFIPKNHTLTLAQMSDEERANRIDDNTSALDEFAKWCSKEKSLIKR